MSCAWTSALLTMAAMAAGTSSSGSPAANMRTGHRKRRAILSHEQVATVRERLPLLARIPDRARLHLVSSLVRRRGRRLDRLSAFMVAALTACHAQASCRCRQCEAAPQNQQQRCAMGGAHARPARLPRGDETRTPVRRHDSDRGRSQPCAILARGCGSSNRMSCHSSSVQCGFPSPQPSPSVIPTSEPHCSMRQRTVRASASVF